MAKSKTSVQLPGQSRSVACSSKSCRRLEGHKGEHRATLHATAKPSPAKAQRSKTAGRVEVHSADRYTVQPEPKVRRTARKAAPKGQCRISRNGQRCRRQLGHKGAGIRHSFAVRVLPTVGPKGRDVQTIKGKTSRRSNYVASSKPSSRLA